MANSPQKIEIYVFFIVLLLKMLQWNFCAQINSGFESVLTPDGYIFLDGKEHTPSVIEIIGMFIAYMDSSYGLMEIATSTGANSETAVVISSSSNAGLIDGSYTPGVMVMPKRLSGNMLCLRILILVDRVGSKVFPSVMIQHFLFIGNG